MSKKRNGVKATVMNGKIYVVGGCSGGNILSCGEVYDPNTDEWTPLPDMNIPRLNYSLFVADGQLVVAGGADGSRRTATTEILNVRENKWVFGRNLMDAKCGSAAVSVSKEMIDPEVLKKLNDLRLEAGFVNASLPTELTMLIVVPALINNPLPHMKSTDMALQKLPIHETSRTNQLLPRLDHPTPTPPSMASSTSWADGSIQGATPLPCCLWWRESGTRRRLSSQLGHHLKASPRQSPSISAA